MTYWQANLLSQYPTLHEHLCCVNPDMPEQAIIPLPSLFNEHTWLSLSISELVHTEYTLCKGQAHDTLEKLCMSICEYNYKAKIKCKEVQSQHANTRMASKLQGIEQEKKRAAESYRHAYLALQHLSLASDNQSLQPLHDNQLFMKNQTKPGELGDNWKEDPWFWQVERCRSSGIEDQAWAVESKMLSMSNDMVVILTEISGLG